tara:strand:+ start:129 stop:281 length:153 start_codon:yes stop_codon:yes gene_type:complete
MSEVITNHDPGDENDNITMAEAAEMIPEETIEAIQERKKLRDEIEESELE